MFPGTIPGKPMPAGLELMQGTLDVLVLRALIWGERHGFAVARWIKESSGQTLEVEDRALYVALHRLESRGHVVSDWGVSDNNRRARYYKLTAAGRRQLRAAEDRWTRYADAVFRVLRASADGSIA